MFVTKFIHSCLLVEDQGKTFLVDPGVYTYQEKALNIDSLPYVDYLLITHEHPDHMFVPLIKEILLKFPGAIVITNFSAANILVKEKVPANTEAPDFIKIETIPHEKIFGGMAPENILFRINDYLTDPGDSHSFKSTTRVLALPVQAPWGSLTNAVNLAEKLKPEVIIPIHDWHWNEEARDTFYKRLVDYFAKINIKFIPLQTGQRVGI